VEKMSPGLSVVLAGKCTDTLTEPAGVVSTGMERTSGKVSRWPSASPTFLFQKAMTGMPPPTRPRSSLLSTGAPKGFSWENFAGTGKISSFPHFKLEPSNVHIELFEAEGFV